MVEEMNGLPCWDRTKVSQSGAASSLAVRLATNVPSRSFLSVSVAISLCAVVLLGPVTLLVVE